MCTKKLPTDAEDSNQSLPKPSIDAARAMGSVRVAGLVALLVSTASLQCAVAKRELAIHADLHADDGAIVDVVGGVGTPFSSAMPEKLFDRDLTSADWAYMIKAINQLLQANQQPADDPYHFNGAISQQGKEIVLSWTAMWHGDGKLQGLRVNFVPKMKEQTFFEGNGLTRTVHVPEYHIVVSAGETIARLPMPPGWKRLCCCKKGDRRTCKYSVQFNNQLCCKFKYGKLEDGCEKTGILRTKSTIEAGDEHCPAGPPYHA
mmetsp:Transcript_98286/g.305697  ORF Transcript_98286/g.305697 Transcript_98286/m.305697 type:complete len:261 (+) Transcript_98286:3-785(+)